MTKRFALQTILAEGAAFANRLLSGSVEDRDTVRLVIEDTERMFDMLEKTLKEIRIAHIEALRRVEARMIDREAMIRDDGAVAQETQIP